MNTPGLANFADRFPSVSRIATEITALSTTWDTASQTAIRVRRLARELEKVSAELVHEAEQLEASVARCGGEEVERELRSVIRPQTMPATGT